jgi:transposase-like protein
VTATATEHAEQAFVTVSGNRRSEVARTLAAAAGLLHRWRRA